MPPPSYTLELIFGGSLLENFAKAQIRRSAEDALALLSLYDRARHFHTVPKLPPYRFRLDDGGEFLIETLDGRQKFDPAKSPSARPLDLEPSPLRIETLLAFGAAEAEAEREKDLLEAATITAPYPLPPIGEPAEEQPVVTPEPPAVQAPPIISPEPPEAQAPSKAVAPSDVKSRRQWVWDTIEKHKRSLAEKRLTGWLIDRYVDDFGKLGLAKEFLNLRHLFNSDLRALRKALPRRRRRQIKR